MKTAILSLFIAISIPIMAFSEIMPRNGNITDLKPIVVRFHKQETASWYAKYGDYTDPWVHTTTANGEKFNENGLTAASWKYPLGSMVRVTNRMNGKSVVVRINDRGPSKRLYNKGRTMDLTKGAFSQIANLNEGVIRIESIRVL